MPQGKFSLLAFTLEGKGTPRGQKGPLLKMAADSFFSFPLKGKQVENIIFSDICELFGCVVTVLLIFVVIR